MSPVASASEIDVGEAEKLIWGGDGHHSPETGRRMLEQAAANGDVTAKRTLGLHLVFGWVFKTDVSAGLELLNQAVAAGDPEAQTSLAEIYLWGLAGETDLVKARNLLEAASNVDHPKAVRTLGEQLITGRYFDQDVDAGLTLLKRGASKSDAKAYIAIGKLLLYGRGLPQDRMKALNAFKAAAALGDGRGLAIHGEDLMWRGTDARAAEALLLRAAELGETGAYATLAEGALYGYSSGGAFSRSKYTKYSEMALEVGDERVAIFEAERSMWGIGRRASGKQAIADLTAEADKGNVLAAKYLVGLLRDGNNLNVRRSIRSARAALEKYGHLLSKEEKARFDLTMAAAAANTLGEYEPVAASYAAQPELRSVDFGKELFKANSNVAFYILQERFKAEGVYNGLLSGFATRQTLRAVYKACMAHLEPEICDDTVMRPDVIGGLLAQR